MAYTEDHIALAAEYALGTLDADERAQVETMMAVDEAFAAIVQAWAFRLGALNQMVGSVEPRPIVWENIRSEIARTALAQQPPVLAEIAPPPIPPIETAPPEAPSEQPPQPQPQPTEAGQPEPMRSGSDAIADIAPVFMPQIHAPDPEVVRTPQVPIVDDGNVIRLEGRVKRWRSIASAVGALAAALLVTLSLQLFLPDALPGALRP
ncbi:hypothetical protein MOV75_33260, partial [Bradyrhizobium sp. PRIMUS42]|nr:hypothetical protein [Bradyrhizobium sp. PRIMUS42]